MFGDEPKYHHVSVYSTNYDEILPRILGWKDRSMSLQDSSFDYSPLNQHKLRQSYSNLHGSIHLKLSQFDGQQYTITHSSIYYPALFLHENYGGNPHEFDLFTPIIVGSHKTQLLLSKHFN